MKKYLFVIAAVIVSIGVVAAPTIRDQIAARLEPVGTVCVEGEDCEAAAATETVANADSGGDMKDPEAIYNQSCSTCHQVGVAGAPKFGNADEWAPRIEKGMDTLYSSVIDGMPPGMPAKGMCFTCSEAELKAVTDYMVAAAE